MASRKTGEFERIATFFAPLAAGFPGALGLTDDAAILRPAEGAELVVTTDTIVAGVHYIGDEPADLVAQKLLRVNLSDLAAKGARPVAYTLNIALPTAVEDDWLERFCAGLAADQQRFGIVLAGGDSVATPGPVTLTITAFGEIAVGRMLRRSGARPGDRIYVSGTIGDGALGLKILRGRLAGIAAVHRDFLVERYRRPQPRVACGARLVGIAHAAMDISDGLVADLAHIADVSGVAAVVEAASVPLSTAAAAALEIDPQLRDAVLGGGDDYELLFTAPPDAAPSIAALAAGLGLPLTAIGRIEAGRGVCAVDAAGAEIALARAGYTHG
jgi:thiamine-monophosphate kinase